MGRRSGRRLIALVAVAAVAVCLALVGPDMALVGTDMTLVGPDMALAARPGRVAVLVYHDVAPVPDGAYTVTPDRLEGDLRWLLAHGWRPLSLAKFAEWMAGRSRLVADSFLLTFDDGYASLASQVVPVLHRLRVPAVAFVITGHLGAGDRFERAKLLPAEVTELAASGLVSFGSHSEDLHHPVGPDRLPAVFYADPPAVAADLATSARRLRYLTGQVPIALAWPGGRAPGWAQELASERFALTFVGGDQFARQGEPYAITRFSMEWRSPADLERQFR